MKGQQEVLSLYPNGNGGKIPFHSRIGTKLIVGFLIIATITGSLGYLGLNYAQTVGEKFHLLQKQTLPTINSLGQMKVASTQYRRRCKGVFYSRNQQGQGSTRFD